MGRGRLAETPSSSFICPAAFTYELLPLIVSIIMAAIAAGNPEEPGCLGLFSLRIISDSETSVPGPVSKAHAVKSL